MKMFDSASNTEVLTMAGTVFSSGIGFDVSDRVHLQQDCLASYDRSSYWPAFHRSYTCLHRDGLGPCLSWEFEPAGLMEPPKTRSTASRRCVVLKGFDKSGTSMRLASLSRVGSAKPETKMIFAWGWSFFRASASSVPNINGMRTSTMKTS